MANFRTRGYLPHLEHPGATYFVTFRLAGTLPRRVLESWAFERKDIQQEAKRQGRRLTDFERGRLRELYSWRIQNYLDEGKGSCWLKDPRIASLVVDALKYFDHIRYNLIAWCVMPNHVHVVFAQLGAGGPEARGTSSANLSTILQSWKSHTAKKANTVLNRTGRFWHLEYYDHLIRNDEELAHYIEYTLQNPVKAGLCRLWRDWLWSGLAVGNSKLDA